MRYITNEDLNRFLPYQLLVDALEDGFKSKINVPIRHHHPIKTGGLQNATLLLMPAWQTGNYLGVKLVTVYPENKKIQKPTIQGIYLLYDATNGTPIAQMDAKTLTNIRTAAASVLAAKHLAASNCKSLLLLGTGALLPYFISAYTSLFELEQIWVWGRNHQKAVEIVSNLKIQKHLPIQAVKNKDNFIPKADLISTITLSEMPIIEGHLLREGQHLDLVGSYKPNMREADDECIKRAQIFVDSKSSAIKETGDLCIPIQKGILKEAAIQGDFFDLNKSGIFERKNKKDITLFKSVGNALEDLIAAGLAYEALLKDKTHRK